MNKIIISFIFISSLSCNRQIDIANDSLPIKDVCIDACDNRFRLSCLEKKLVETCVPTCHITSKAGLYDPYCSAEAKTKEEMLRCRVRCQ